MVKKWSLDILEFIGFAAIVYGVAMIYIPAGFIIAGAIGIIQANIRDMPTQTPTVIDEEE